MKYHGIEHINSDGYAEICSHAQHCQHQGCDKCDMRIEELVDGCKYYPETLKEYRPAKHHLAPSYRGYKHLAYREIEEKDEKKGKEEIERQQI